MNPVINIKKIAILSVGVLLGVILLFIFADRVRTDSGIDSKPEGVDTDFSSHANIVDGEELLHELGSLDSLDSLSQDLHYFGQAAYEAYKTDPNRVVGFRVTSEIRMRNNLLEIDGNFGSSRNKVNVKVESLNNGRVRSSLTDTETGFNVDAALPSNSKLNQFLGNLPINGEGYSINYVAPDGVEIAIYTSSQAIYDRAYQSIVDAIGKDETEKLDISMSLPSPTFGN